LTAVTTLNGFDLDHVDFDRLDELEEFANRVCIAESGRPFVTRDRLVRTFDRPEFVPERDSVLLRDSDGHLVAAEWVSFRHPFIHASVEGFVAPEHTGKGIGTALLDRIASSVRDRTDEAPEGARVVLNAGVDVKHEPSVALMTGYGMELTRYFLEMRIDFAEDTPEPRFPSGLELRTFSPGVDDEAFALAVDDAFRDHFGHVERPTEIVVDGFRRRMTGDDFDPTLWWMVLDGDEVAAAALCEPRWTGTMGSDTWGCSVFAGRGGAEGWPRPSSTWLFTSSAGGGSGRPPFMSTRPIQPAPPPSTRAWG
jgi:GNAT superfamily N-acetyltransferase